MQDFGAAHEDVTRRQADGNDMRDHHRVSVGAAHSERTHGRDVCNIERLDRLAEQRVSAGVLQRHAILRAPLDLFRIASIKWFAASTLP